MLVGEAGIGKTRLAEELAAVAEQEGFIVRWGHSHEADGAPPFWPWIQALREQLGGSDVNDLPTLMGLGNPQFHRHDPESARFRLFDATSSFVKNVARKTSVLVVLDDLHWADPPTLLLLEFLARELTRSPVLLLGTYRDVELDSRHALSETLGELARTRLRTLELKGLNGDAVRQLLQDALGERPTQELRRSVQAQTEGNPFFVTEIAHLLAQEKALGVERERSSFRIPESVKATLTRRLHRLSELSHDVLVTAAVIGREFDFGLLGELRSDVVEAQLLRAIEEARDGHIIVESSEGSERYQFRHALIREVLYREPSPSHRARLHARIAKTLERRNSDDQASLLAHHFAAAESVLGPAKRAVYSRIAGTQALLTHAYDDALRHFESAWEVKKNAPLDAESAEILFGLGVSAAATSVRWNRQTGWEHLQSAVDYYIEKEDVARAVAAATHPSITPEGAFGVAPVILRVLDRVPPGSRDEGWLIARHAAASYFETGDYDTARRQFRRALSIARRHKDDALELRTLAYETSVDHFDIRWADVLAKSQRVIDLARKNDEPHAETYARFRAAYALMCTGRSSEARVEANANLVRAEQLGDQGLLEDAVYVAATLAQLEGDWSKARELSDRGFEISPSLLPLLHSRVLLEYELGEAEDGARYLERLVESSSRAGPYPLREIFVAVAIAQTAPLAERAAGFGQPGAEPRTSAVPIARVTMEIAQAMAAIQKRDVDLDVDAVEDHLENLVAYRGLILAPCLVTDRLLGRLAQKLGRPREAVRHYEAAAIFCRTASYQPELAWTCYDFAGALIDRDGKGDRVEAASLLEEARGIASELSMRPLADLVSRFQARHRAKLVRKPDGLTSRELEVLELVAAGMTNKLIGQKLFISVNTVAVHVARILEKTHSKNRTEAANYAIRHHLVQTPAEK